MRSSFTSCGWFFWLLFVDSGLFDLFLSFHSQAHLLSPETSIMSESTTITNNNHNKMGVSWRDGGGERVGGVILTGQIRWKLRG